MNDSTDHVIDPDLHLPNRMGNINHIKIKICFLSNYSLNNIEISGNNGNLIGVINGQDLSLNFLLYCVVLVYNNR